MEDWKLQQLHDTLAKLRPQGHSGLGVRSQTIGVGHKHRENGLPSNALYARFVKEGHFKKTFVDSDNDNEASADEDLQEKRKRLKAEKKARKAERAARRAVKASSKLRAACSSDTTDAIAESAMQAITPNKSKRKRSEAEVVVSEVNAEAMRKRQKKEAKAAKTAAKGGVALTFDVTAEPVNIAAGSDELVSPTPAVVSVPSDVSNGSSSSSNKLKKTKRSKDGTVANTGVQPMEAVTGVIVKSKKRKLLDDAHTGSADQKSLISSMQNVSVTPVDDAKAAKQARKAEKALLPQTQSQKADDEVQIATAPAQSVSNESDEIDAVTARKLAKKAAKAAKKASQQQSAETDMIASAQQDAEKSAAAKKASKKANAALKHAHSEATAAAHVSAASEQAHKLDQAVEIHNSSRKAQRKASAKQAAAVDSTIDDSMTYTDSAELERAVATKVDNSSKKKSKCKRQKSDA